MTFTEVPPGSGQSPETVAEAVCAVLTHPPDSIIDLVSVRAFI